MEISVKHENSTMTVNLSGRLDTSTAPDLEKILSEAGGASELILDLKDLSYTSSAGLRVFLKAQKMMNRQGKMRIIHVCPEIREIFEITGFTEILTIE